MQKSDNLIRLALLFALTIHCLFLLVAWKFYEPPPNFLELPLEVSIEFEEPEPVIEEAEEIIEEPEPVIEEVEEVIEEPEPVIEEVEEVIEEPEPVIEEVEEVIEEPEPVIEEVEEVIEEPEPLPEWLEEIIEEPEPVPEEPEKMIEESESVSEESEEIVESLPVSESQETVASTTDSVLEEAENLTTETDFRLKEKKVKKAENSSQEQGKISDETGSNLGKGKSSSQKQNQIKKSQFPPSYLQIVISKIVSAKRYPRFARDRGMEGKVLLEFVILGSGELKEVKVLGSSEYSILDQAAVETLQRAAPFPPVPGKENTDLVTMRLAIAFELES